MKTIIKIDKREDIFSHYHNTPISDLLEYHNLRAPHKKCEKAELLVGMCMDARKNLNIPENFAYVLRAGGANLRYSEFKISYAIGIGGIKAIALIAHDQCGMVNLVSRKESFVQGLVDNAGWKHEKAEEHFRHFAPMFEVGNAIDFVVGEAKRLRDRYPKIQVAPLLYTVEDNLLSLIREET